MRQKTKKRKKERARREVRRMGAAIVSYRVWAVQMGVILGMVLVVSFIGMFLFSPLIAVRSVEVTRLSSRLDIEEVQEALTPIFQKHLFFLTSFEVTELLMENIADIDSVKIGKTYPSTLHVAIKLHPLVARLKIVSPDESVHEQTGTGTVMSLLTEKGMYVSTIAAQDTETLPLMHLVDWGARPQPGDLLIPPVFLERMNAAEIAFLRQFGKEVEQRTVFLRAQEFHFTLSGIAFWFDLKNPLEEQLRRYRMFLQAVSLNDVREYVDLRLSDRVVYK